MAENRVPFQQVNETQPDDQRPPISLEQLAQQIRETADKLIRDGVSRGW